MNLVFHHLKLNQDLAIVFIERIMVHSLDLMELLNNQKATIAIALIISIEADNNSTIITTIS